MICLQNVSAVLKGLTYKLKVTLETDGANWPWGNIVTGVYGYTLLCANGMGGMSSAHLSHGDSRIDTLLLEPGDPSYSIYMYIYLECNVCRGCSLLEKKMQSLDTAHTPSSRQVTSLGL